MAHNRNSNGPKDSKPDDVSDSISPFSGDVNSVNKNDDGSTTDCGADSDVPTAVIDNEKENIEKLVTFISNVLVNEQIPDYKMEWPLCLLFESNQSVTLSQEDLKNIILNKAAEVVATHGTSDIEKQMLNISECEHQQRLYYNKYKELLNYVNIINSKLGLLKRVPDDNFKHVRNAETYVNMPTISKKPL
ncbi:uncharacterized protein LOC132934961 [Metopolophium dirhodum]|uniref:uncharacterized protein LOC132934961 n=1 Tax=Metopolophium dirhodum TaxID=44670 RepID=UPI0029907E95|nr:uncharacterized protein LOC132934961 [Metopolophium dirhodum]XP_060857386.1 uncharacterized protein LOC132934961 [Metopolophium dirhodum]